MKQTLKDYTLITLGTLSMSAGIYFFKFPNNFSTGGVSGISVILQALFPRVSAGTFVLIFNCVLLIIGFLVLGKSFGLRTVYSSLLMSAAIFIAERVLPLSAPLTNQPFLELIYSVILPAVGSAVLFNTKASSGGTDIVAMIMRKYSYGVHIPYYFKIYDILSFDYKINTNITIGTNIKQEKVYIDKLNVILSIGL